MIPHGTGPAAGRPLAVVFVLFLLFQAPSTAQTFQYQGEAGLLASARTALPFWFHANQRGRVDPSSTNRYAHLRVAYRSSRPATVGYGFGTSTTARTSARSTLFFEELYAQVHVGAFQMHAGRKHEVFGTVDRTLSSGILVLSDNAVPVPKVALSTRRYLDVPYTEGFVQVRGYLAHGWMHDPRYVRHPYLHQKYVYVRFGRPERTTLHWGLIHNAMWGGSSSRASTGQLPQSLRDFVLVFRGGSGKEGAPYTEQINLLGNHVGMHDIALTVNLRGVQVLIYRQVLFEDESGMKMHNWPDGLLGLSIADEGSGRLVSRATYEFVHTKNQSGSLHPPGRDNYFNNAVYRSGWTHYGRVLGTPLITPRKPDEDEAPADANNRLVGHHLGLAGRPSPAVAYRLLVTYTRNYGTYKTPFAPARTQLSMLLESHVTLSEAPRVELILGGGLDRGRLYGDRAGFRLGLRYRGSR